MSKPLRLTKKVRTYLYKTYHLFPHQVIGAEIKSMQLRLEDANKLRDQQKHLLESMEERQTFHKTLKTDLPATEKLIARLQEETKQATKDFQYQQNKVLRLQNSK
ncbi:MAG: hypothetical protein KXJ49_00490 [Vulcanococcus sp.]|uniref:hypothetical protein n=1 Tax=Vulcanococcus sp. TaxID=2856995 RepID=UPI0025E7DA03|nr:hypothetical protein [Vulcanococcus sp.]MBW0165959.1 hypothetical protein [Vulcanococcus sp.]